MLTIMPFLFSKHPDSRYSIRRFWFDTKWGAKSSASVTDEVIARLLIDQLEWQHNPIEHWTCATLEEDLQEEKKAGVIIYPANLRRLPDVPEPNEMRSWWVDPVTKELDKTGEKEGSTVQLGRMSQ